MRPTALLDFHQKNLTHLTLAKGTSIEIPYIIYYKSLNCLERILSINFFVCFIPHTLSASSNFRTGKLNVVHYLPNIYNSNIVLRIVLVLASLLVYVTYCLKILSSDVSCVAENLGLAVDDGLQNPYHKHRPVQHSKVKNNP